MLQTECDFVPRGRLSAASSVVQPVPLVSIPAWVGVHTMIQAALCKCEPSMPAPTQSPTRLPTANPTPVECNCRTDVTDPVCHTASATDHTNLCLAWCSGHTGTVTGPCSQNVEEETQSCNGVVLGNFYVPTAPSDATVSDFDLALFLQGANVKIREAGSQASLS